MRHGLQVIARGEYTGDQRCWPCTVVNLLIVGGLALVLVRFDRWLLAVALVAVGAFAVAVRGYVIPFTPWFAPRLVAPIPGDPFNVRPHGQTDNPAIEPREKTAKGGTIAGVDERPNPEAVLETLAEEGAVDINGEEVSLDPSFVDTWEAAMADLRSLDDDELAAAVAELAPAATVEAVSTAERTWMMLADENRAPASQVWLSKPATIAETAAARTLEDWIDDSTDRLTAAAGLRGFLEECPVCETPLVETTTASCCGGHIGTPEPVLACEVCSVRLFTLPQV